MGEVWWAWVSMVLTSTLLRRHEPKANRGIPTILRECFDGGTVDVSAVDTGLLAGSAPGGLGGRAGRSHPVAGLTFPQPGAQHLGEGRRPARTTRVARETLCHVDVAARTVLRWHAFHFQHGD
ncbi:hypothetical protein BKH32_04585 [Actinomyces oris]|uniref:Uncharacterized protein n=1 Tax=Actinomyces oris TaxID=544580 RepID=A0A1Q8I295_9ACTO|nr:hypothetical protein BKH32_04585 [Actinomyces oris]